MDPIYVDRLLVSSFVEINEISFSRNRFIKDYIITSNQKEEHSHLQVIIKIIKTSKGLYDFEDLIKLFEFVVSPTDKIVTGAVYTPNNIREYIISNTLNTSNNIKSKIADISCGCGSFLFDVAKKLKMSFDISYFEIFRDNLFGLDIQSYSVTRAKLLLTLLALSEGEDVADFSYNLFVGNALSFKWEDNINDFNGFEIIVGNPPYVCSRNISEESKKLLNNWEVCKTGHPDLYIPFFQIGIENLAYSGILGYITMNTFFKSVNGRALREYFQNNQYRLRIVDFGNNQIFQSKSTYTCICFIEKTDSSYIEFASSNEFFNDLSFNKITYSALNPLKGWNLKEKDLVDKIEETGTPFGKLYKTRNGIATLKNNIYIFSPIDETKDYYYLQNGSIYEIEKQICKDIINPNKFTQVNNVSAIKKKVIFPYKHFNDKVILLEEDQIRNKYPKAYKYLSDKKKDLATRDKGNGQYENWYAYGRNQSLEKLKYKLFFPHITPTTPNFIINTDENLLFYNGLAVITENERELYFLEKLMTSRLFWMYIRLSSKPYGSGYYSLSRNYIKNFGVYNFDDEEKEFIINTKEKGKLDSFIESKYKIRLEKFN